MYFPVKDDHRCWRERGLVFSSVPCGADRNPVIKCFTFLLTINIVLSHCHRSQSQK